MCQGACAATPREQQHFGKSARTTNAIEPFNDKFRRRLET
jgi:transposase-like protein